MARLFDMELAAVDFRTEGLLMAPAFAVPRLLARHGLTHANIACGKATRPSRLSTPST